MVPTPRTASTIIVDEWMGANMWLGGPGVRIVSASFGVQGDVTRSRDVAAELQAQLTTNGSVWLSASAFRWGDPAVGTKKQLVVKFDGANHCVAGNIAVGATTAFTKSVVVKGALAGGALAWSGTYTAGAILTGIVASPVGWCATAACVTLGGVISYMHMGSTSHEESGGDAADVLEVAEHANEGFETGHTLMEAREAQDHDAHSHTEHIARANATPPESQPDVDTEVNRPQPAADDDFCRAHDSAADNPTAASTGGGWGGGGSEEAGQLIAAGGRHWPLIDFNLNHYLDVHCCGVVDAGLSWCTALQ